MQCLKRLYVVSIALTGSTIESYWISFFVCDYMCSHRETNNLLELFLTFIHNIDCKEDFKACLIPYAHITTPPNGAGPFLYNSWAAFTSVPFAGISGTTNILYVRIVLPLLAVGSDGPLPRITGKSIEHTKASKSAVKYEAIHMKSDTYANLPASLAA